MKPPFETLTLLASDAEAFVTDFDRPGHSALVTGPWFYTEFDEYVESFEDPHVLIQAARDFDLAAWIAKSSAQQTQFEDTFGALFQAMTGPLPDAPPDGSSEAQRYVHAARQRFADEAPPDFIKDLEATLEDASQAMNAPQADPLPELLNIMNRLQKVQDQAESLDDNLRTIQTISQFFMGEQVGKATDAAPFASAPTASETPADPATETVIAILPVDDPWAALAWMQHGSYMHQPVPLLAAARDMALRCDAHPISATSDSIRFSVGKPAKASEDVAMMFQTLGASTLNDAEIAPHDFSKAKEWLIWWD